MSALWPPRVRTILASLALFVLLLPAAAVYLARIYENHLVRETEKILLSEAVLVGEVLRASVDPAAKAALPPPPEVTAEFHPFTAKLDLRGTPILPAAAREGQGVSSASVTPPLERLLERAILRNLSGIRVLDRTGVVIASPKHERGYSLAHLPEVQAALRGGYQPVLRERRSDEARPPLSSLSRAAHVRVSLAIPVFSDPYAPVGSGAAVIGAVFVSRTPLDMEKGLWLIRGELIGPLVVILLLTLLTIAALSAAIERPLRRLRDAASRVAAGDPQAALAVSGFAPEEIHTLSAALARMRAELETRARYVQEFAANTAHELKTPLTSLRGAAELLLDGGDAMDPAQTRRFLGNIHEDALRMDRLVSRILQLARIEAAEAHPTGLDLSSFLARTSERWARRGANVAVACPAGLTIAADPEQLEAALTSLLENAARHGGEGPIELSAKVEGEGVELAVADRGPVLPPGHFDRAFERFYTTERDRGGTGLGLSIVRAVAVAHGGRASAEVRPEGGACLRLWLPAERR